MNQATRAAYAYLKARGIHPPRRPNQARALARLLRGEEPGTRGLFIELDDAGWRAMMDTLGVIDPTSVQGADDGR